MTKLTKKDQYRIATSYFKKIEEYDKMTLEELRALFPSLKATYREACIAVVDKKLQEEKQNKVKELVEDNKSALPDTNQQENIKDE